jgi:hypothetical protein
LKIAAIVVGLFIAGLAYLSYRGMDRGKMGRSGKCN